MTSGNDSAPLTGLFAGPVERSDQGAADVSGAAASGARTDPRDVPRRRSPRARSIVMVALGLVALAAWAIHNSSRRPPQPTAPAERLDDAPRRRPAHPALRSHRRVAPRVRVPRLGRAHRDHHQHVNARRPVIHTPLPAPVPTPPTPAPLAPIAPPVAPRPVAPSSDEFF